MAFEPELILIMNIFTFFVELGSVYPQSEAVATNCFTLQVKEAINTI